MGALHGALSTTAIKPHLTRYELHPTKRLLNEIMVVSMSKNAEHPLDPKLGLVPNNAEMHSSVPQRIQCREEQTAEALKQTKVAKDTLPGCQQRQLLAAPIMNLPNELLSRIFVVACEDEDVRLHLAIRKEDSVHQESHGGELEHRRSTAFILAEVCSYWRHTAIAIGSLWARADIGGVLDDRDSAGNEGRSSDSEDEEGDAARQREASFYACIRTVFERSGQHALGVKWALVTPLSRDKLGGFDSALETVILHSGRTSLKGIVADIP
jgi:hypothetical protein